MEFLWLPKQLPGSNIVNEPGTICWSELITPDQAVAAGFHKAIIGITTETIPMDANFD